jgi:hypothetical protein
MLVISESTRRQIGAFFEIEELGPQTLAGFGDPQRAWEQVSHSTLIEPYRVSGARPPER